MLTTLFSSKTRAQILTTLFMSPETALNALELSQRLNVSYSLVWKELAQLEKASLLVSTQRGRARFYKVNMSNPIAPELKMMVIKTTGVGDAIREALEKENSIRSAFIFGSFASGEADERSDVDILVIGEISLTRFSETIATLEKRLSRAVNYVILSESEWKKRIEGGDAFILNIINAPKVMLIGGEDAL